MTELETLLSELTPRIGLLKVWEEGINTLERKEVNVNIVDFDDTIFSRKQQLEDDERIRNNRGGKGIDLIINTIGVKKYIEKYYLSREIPEEIINILNKDYDLILTAGEYELQKAKLDACSLSKFNSEIVYSGEDKIIAAIRYIIYTLSFIPSCITVYEDRPEYFVKFRPLIEGVFGCKLIIKKVDLYDGLKIEEI